MCMTLSRNISRAVYLPEGLLRCTDNNLPAMYVPRLRLNRFFAERPETDVPAVVYTGAGAAKGWGDGLEQTMMAYSLVRFGHNLVYVLDGGSTHGRRKANR